MSRLSRLKPRLGQWNEQDFPTVPISPIVVTSCNSPRGLGCGHNLTSTLQAEQSGAFILALAEQSILYNSGMAEPGTRPLRIDRACTGREASGGNENFRRSQYFASSSLPNPWSLVFFEHIIVSANELGICVMIPGTWSDHVLIMPVANTVVLWEGFVKKSFYIIKAEVKTVSMWVGSLFLPSQGLLSIPEIYTSTSWCHGCWWSSAQSPQLMVCFPTNGDEVQASDFLTPVNLPEWLPPNWWVSTASDFWLGASKGNLSRIKQRGTERFTSWWSSILRPWVSWRQGCGWANKLSPHWRGHWWAVRRCIADIPNQSKSSPHTSAVRYASLLVPIHRLPH